MTIIVLAVADRGLLKARAEVNLKGTTCMGWGGGTERLDIFVEKRGDFTMFLSTGRAIYHVSQVHINSLTGRFKLHEIGVANKIPFLIGQFTLWLLLWWRIESNSA